MNNQLHSRLLISGAVSHVDDLDRLARAIVLDMVPVHGIFTLDTLEEVLDHIERDKGRPLELADDDRGRTIFEWTKKTCRDLGLAYVHEFSDDKGHHCQCHDPAAIAGAESYSFSGTVENPTLAASAFEAFQGFTDEELGQLARSMLHQAERGASLASANLHVEAAAMDEMRTSRVPATGRGLL